MTIKRIACIITALMFMSFVSVKQKSYDTSVEINIYNVTDQTVLNGSVAIRNLRTGETKKKKLSNIKPNPNKIESLGYASSLRALKGDTILYHVLIDGGIKKL
jgi:hypothetical protein